MHVPSSFGDTGRRYDGTMGVYDGGVLWTKVR